jgi:D-alanyl-D-alanine carboxypeptidase (penicillin-binding protein 5/6)
MEAFPMHVSGHREKTMRHFLPRLILSASLLLLPLASPVAADIVTLRSQHKFAPDQGSGVSREEPKRFEIVNLVSSDSFKQRPAGLPELAGVSAPGLQRKLSSRSAFVMDARTGRVIYAHQPDLPGQPASTLKIVTGLVALESLSGSEMVPASRYAANMPRSKIYLKPGASYRANDLINAVLLASANDASVALAEKIAGSEQVFARLMTKKAEALGATQTVFKNANGLTSSGQQTTARDLAVLFNNAMRNTELAKRLSMGAVRTSDGKTLRSHNRALWSVEGALGGKTGYTAAARQTYVGKFRRGEQELVVALLGSETMWNDVASLVEYGFSRQQTAGFPVSDGDDSETVRVPLASRSLAGESGGLVVLNEQGKFGL